MTTVNDQIAWLLPNGSSRAQSGSHSMCPIWPPDLFAVAASLVETSEAYVRLRYCAAHSKGFMFTEAFHRKLYRWGEEWRSTYKVPTGVQMLWKKLLQHSYMEICGGTNLVLGDIEQISSERDQWLDAAMTLLLAADEAAWGIGFYSDTMPAALYLKYYSRHNQKQNVPLQLPHSICSLVPAERACVQPKTSTPQTGCTLRFLTHHLALLPSRGIVRTQWHLSTKPNPKAETARALEEGAYNLLLVPFPYRVRERAITECGKIPPSLYRKSGKKKIKRSNVAYGFFGLDHDWIPTDRDQAAEDIAKSAGGRTATREAAATKKTSGSGERKPAAPAGEQT